MAPNDLHEDSSVKLTRSASK